MPVIKETVEQLKARMLRSNIEMHQRKLGFSDERMAKALGINPQVYRRKVLHSKQSYQFTYRELITVFQILKFTEEEKLESI